MEMLFGIGGLVIGIAMGYAIASRQGGGKPVGPAHHDEHDWWEVRKALTGTQLQILQFMETSKEASITSLQEKFSFIPDRELFYRLEQIVLMGFIERDRADGDVVYRLNPLYSGKVEDDKTVMLPNG